MSNFIYFIVYYFFDFHQQPRKTMQNTKKVKHSLLFVKKQLYHKHGVRIVTVKNAACVDRVRRSFLSDRSLSKLTSEFFSLINL